MQDFDVAVIASGALGASAAFHLARMGRNIVLIDKAEIGSQTSPARRACRASSAGPLCRTP